MSVDIGRELNVALDYWNQKGYGIMQELGCYSSLSKRLTAIIDSTSTLEQYCPFICGCGSTRKGGVWFNGG